MKYIDEFRDSRAVVPLVERIKAGAAAIGRPLVLMEVCGTHTMAISRAGLRPLLGPEVELISGPGCPVCVTSDADIDRAIALASLPGVTLATFGDMIRVPGTEGSLADASAHGADVKVVYSPLDALELAEADPDRKVIFLGVGFETTAPTVAATILEARAKAIDNFHVLSLHKLVPPALRALASLPDFGVDGFMLPGHVSAVTGSRVYDFLPCEYGMPCVVAGFEATDILQAIEGLLAMRRDGLTGVLVEYGRAVSAEGNTRAQAVMQSVFEPAGAEWRGLFHLANSGLAIRGEFAEMDAGQWDVDLPAPKAESGCRCGDVLCGRIRPPECGLFAERCTPEDPVGPCMVSSEGTCASYYLYECEVD